MALVLGLLVLVVIAVVVQRIHQRSPRQRTRRLIRELKLACHGDQDLVERLIFAELQQSPSIDYAEATRRALARVERDRR